MVDLCLGLFRKAVEDFCPRLISQLFYDVDHSDYYTVAPLGSDLHNKSKTSPNTIDISAFSSSKTWSDINANTIDRQLSALFLDIESIDSINTAGLTSGVYVLEAGNLIAYAEDISYYFTGGSGNELYRRAVSPCFVFDGKLALITITTDDNAGDVNISRWEGTYTDTIIELTETTTKQITGIGGDVKNKVTLNKNASKCAVLIGEHGYIISDINQTTFSPSILQTTAIPAVSASTSEESTSGTKTIDYKDTLRKIVNCHPALDESCNEMSGKCNTTWGTYDYHKIVKQEEWESTTTSDYTTGTNTGELIAYGYDIEEDSVNFLIRRYGEYSIEESGLLSHDTTDNNITLTCFKSTLDEDSEFYNNQLSRTKTPSSYDRIEYHSKLSDVYIGNPTGGTVVLQTEYEYAYLWEQDYEKQDGSFVSDITTSSLNKKNGEIIVSDIIDISAGCFALSLNHDTWTLTQHTYDEKKYFYDGIRNVLTQTFTDSTVAAFPTTPTQPSYGTTANYNKTDDASETPITPTCGGGKVCFDFPQCPDEDPPTCDFTPFFTYNFDSNDGNDFGGATGCYVETWNFE